MREKPHDEEEEASSCFPYVSLPLSLSHPTSPPLLPHPSIPPSSSSSSRAWGWVIQPGRTREVESWWGREREGGREDTNAASASSASPSSSSVNVQNERMEIQNLSALLSQLSSVVPELANSWSVTCWKQKTRGEKGEVLFLQRTG